MKTEDQDSLIKQFEKETGKHAIWRGKITKGYEQWKKKRKEKTIPKTSVQLTFDTSLLNEIQSNIQNIFSRLNNFEYRLKNLENTLLPTKNTDLIEDISQDQFFRFLKVSYNSIEKKFGDFIPISTLTESIKEYLPWPNEKIHSELYKLFTDYKIDLQPGKEFEGEPLRQDGKTFVWFKFKNQI